MAKKYDFQSRVAEYKKLVTAAKAHEAVLPSLARFGTELEKAVEEIESTKERQLNLEKLRLEATDTSLGQPRRRPREGDTAEELRQGQLRPER